MTVIPPIQPKPKHVVALVPHGGQLIGVLSFMEALQAANDFRTFAGKQPHYSLDIRGAKSTTTTTTGLQLNTAEAPVHAIDTLVVGGSLAHAQTATPPEFRRTVADLASRARRVVSICTGAFVLGEIGLLDDRRCTTHWLALTHLQQRFPRAHVQPDSLYTDDGPLWTSAGATAGLDLALHLLRLEAGPKTALAVARALVVFAHRPGGQSQFAGPQTLLPTADDRMNGLISHIVANPSGDHRVDILARSVGMSPRNFARRFREQLGKTPARFVMSTRIEAAQRALAHSEMSVESVACTSGFGTAESLRRAFHKQVGVSPSSWREHFKTGQLEHSTR